MIAALLLFPTLTSAYDPANCYSWVEHRYGDLPPTANISPNTTLQKGVVALFNYKRSGLEHYAVVEYVFGDGSFWVSECNYDAGECGIRNIPPDYPHLIGFYETPQ